MSKSKFTEDDFSGVAPCEKNMKQIEDFWAESDFEDTVAASLIACFESKVKKNRGAAPSDRLTNDRVAVLRSEGPYIASNSRLVMGSDEGGHWPFDLVNDKLPIKGLYAFRPEGKSKAQNPSAYLIAMYIKQASSLGKYWHAGNRGVLYEMLSMTAENDGIHGDRKFFIVTSGGSVVPCWQEVPNNHGYQPGAKVTTIMTPENESKETGIWASVTLQMLADRRHCWTITAQEKMARAHLGCMQEEIKSLLYARNLPMTSTGRKRPILHLVESHKRRMKSGTDVDISAFLRGVQTVEIGGTLFKVSPPSTLKTDISKPSLERYFLPIAT